MGVPRKSHHVRADRLLRNFLHQRQVLLTVGMQAQQQHIGTRLCTKGLCAFIGIGHPEQVDVRVGSQDSGNAL